jgi:catalase
VLTIAAPVALAQASVQANDFIELFEKLGGSHPGFRSAHARGLCASGTFSPAANTPFQRAPLLSSGERPVTLRFSVGGANPDSDERTPGTRGVGVRIELPEGDAHHFTGNNFPVAAGKDPEAFLGLLSTLLPDENGDYDPEKTLAYVQKTPSVQANAAWRKSARTAASYANTEYFGLHTFHYNPPSGAQTRFRWQLRPDLGVQTLSPEEAAAQAPDFLASRFAQQLQAGAVSFTLEATIGEAGDSDIDPSVQWPQQRTTIALGRILVSKSGGNDCDGINFDPGVLSAGFAPSDDPLLRMRSAAYAISYGKRLNTQ